MQVPFKWTRLRPTGAFLHFTTDILLRNVTQAEDEERYLFHVSRISQKQQSHFSISPSAWGRGNSARLQSVYITTSSAVNIQCITVYLIRHTFQEWQISGTLRACKFQASYWNMQREKRGKKNVLGNAILQRSRLVFLLLFRRSFAASRSATSLKDSSGLCQTQTFSLQWAKLKWINGERLMQMLRRLMQMLPLASAEFITIRSYLRYREKILKNLSTNEHSISLIKRFLAFNGCE